MHTQGARETPGRYTLPGPRPAPQFIEPPRPAPVHDLLVMSHGPETRPADRANHACLNSFARSSRIIAAGG